MNDTTQLTPTLIKFQDIRHVDENGAEFWIARELMPMLGYKRWENFDNAITEAIAVCARECDNAREKNFREAAKVSGTGIITDLEFAAFWNAGYLGLYHEVAKQIRERKNITEKQDIGDHAGSDEIAANIFKASLTRQLMTSRGVKTKDGAIAVHFEAGDLKQQS